MSEQKRGFAKVEYQRRVRALQSGMQDAGLDALLLTSEADFRYVTGFLTRFWESPTRPWFAVLPAKGDPIAIVPSIGLALMATTWLDDIRNWTSPNPEDEGISLLAATLADLVPSSGTVGIPMGPETTLRMPHSDFRRLEKAMAPRKIRDATAIIRDAREIKSEAEIAKIRTICEIAGEAFEAMSGIAKPGHMIDRVFRDFQIACLQSGADYVSYLAGGAGPGGYPDVISPASSRLLATGDILMLDTGAVYDGYFCDFDRNFSVGEPSSAAKRAYDVLYAATEAGFAAVKPGTLASDIWHAMHDVIAASGFEPLDGRSGHGLGTQLTEWPSLMANDHSVLREGMVLTLEPGLQIAPGRIMVHEENIVIRQMGAEMLSPRAPAELPVVC